MKTENDTVVKKWMGHRSLRSCRDFLSYLTDQTHATRNHAEKKHMADPILPAFWRYAKEGEIIGRLLAGYAELEFELGLCLGLVLGDRDAGLRVMFRERGEERRIRKADKQMRPAYESAGLLEAYSAAIDDFGWCKRTRNRYAHCHWYDTREEGLCFLDLEDWAKGETSLEFKKYRLNVPLLEQQEAYFRYVQMALWHLFEKFEETADGQCPLRGRPRSLWELPKKLDRPADHNGVVTDVKRPIV